jgi:hypothetical protein
VCSGRVSSSWSTSGTACVVAIFVCTSLSFDKGVVRVVVVDYTIDC